MKAQMPFDTEKERKTIKFFSYRQTAYLVIAFLIYIQAVQTIYSEKMGIFGFFLLAIALLPVWLPFVYFALYRNQQSGYFMDRHLFYYFRHNSTQAGVWRRR